MSLIEEVMKLKIKIKISIQSINSAYCNYILGIVSYQDYIAAKYEGIKLYPQVVIGIQR